MSETDTPNQNSCKANRKREEPGRNQVLKDLKTGAKEKTSRMKNKWVRVYAINRRKFKR
jgi:hypothetical protein